MRRLLWLSLCCVALVVPLAPPASAQTTTEPPTTTTTAPSSQAVHLDGDQFAVIEFGLGVLVMFAATAFVLSVGRR